MACCVVAAGVYVALNSFYDKTKFDVSSNVVIGLPEPDHKFPYEAVKSVTMEVSGMTCSSCVSSIEDRINAIAGVTGVKVSLLLETCIIAYDPGMVANLDEFKEAIEEIGFEASFAKENRQQKSHEQRKLELLKKTYSFFVLAGVLAASTWVSKLLSRVAFLIDIRPFFIVLSVLLASVAQFYIGPIFYKPTWNTIKNRKPFTMDTLVALSTTLTYIISFTYVVDFFLETSTTLKEAYLDNLCFDLSSGILFVILGGKYYENLGKLKLLSNLSNLKKLLPESALRVNEDNSVVQIPCSVLKKGDMVLVRPGTKVPIDGQVVKGASFVDELCITGEPTPVRKEPNSIVIAGTYNKTSTLTVITTDAVQDSKLAHLFSFIGDTSTTKSRLTDYIQQTVNFFVPSIIVLSILTYVYWMYVSDVDSQLLGLQYARLRALAVVTVACPCALGLAVPAAITQGMNYASVKGCYVRGSGLDILMRISGIKNRTRAFVLFDKTGTLTSRNVVISDFRFKKKMNSILFWKLIIAAESFEDHPIAYTIVEYGQKQLAKLEDTESSDPNCVEFQYIPAKGIECQVTKDSRSYEIKVGNANILPDSSLRTSSDLWFLVDGEVIAECNLINPIRPESEVLLKYLSENNFEYGVVSGDRNEATARLCKKLGITNFWGECTPEDKFKVTRRIQEEYGLPVVMIGDGMNDAAALTQADLGVSLSAAHQLSIDSSEIVLMNDDLLSLIDLLRISVLTKLKMMFNIWVCIIYNIVMVPLAMGFFTPWGVSISPQWSSTLMSFNSVFVLVNSLRIGREMSAAKS